MCTSAAINVAPRWNPCGFYSIQAAAARFWLLERATDRQHNTTQHRKLSMNEVPLKREMNSYKSEKIERKDQRRGIYIGVKRRILSY